jgi:hypothetical protein
MVGRLEIGSRGILHRHAAGFNNLRCEHVTPGSTLAGLGKESLAELLENEHRKVELARLL